MKKLEFAIGSTSPLKIEALRLACKKLGIKPRIYKVKVNIDWVPKQPYGLAETYTGANERALEARDKFHNMIAVGIESGIIAVVETTWRRAFDIACVVVITNGVGGDKHIATTTTGIDVPFGIIDEAYAKGFEKTTVGSVVARKRGGKSYDPHSTLTKGKISRIDTLVDGLVAALKQL